MNIIKGQFWDITANAFRGCSPTSAGCATCWALRFAWRHAHNIKTQGQYRPLVTADPAADPRTFGPGEKIPMKNIRWTGTTSYTWHWAAELKAMKKRQRVLMNCMGDMFHEANQPRDIQHCLDIIKFTPQHLFIVPTKRPGVAVYHLRIYGKKLDNMILLGTTESQHTWDERLPYILDCKPHVAAVGAICEPMITPIMPGPRLAELDWVIAGGETGPGARMCHPNWPWHMACACDMARVPFFFKSWGKTAKGRTLHGVECNGGPNVWTAWR